MGFLRILYFRYKLAQNQKKTYQEIQELQQQKLRRLLNFVYQQSPFYHQFYREHGIEQKDLAEIPVKELPVINKKIMMNNFNDIVIPGDTTTDSLSDG